MAPEGVRIFEQFEKGNLEGASTGFGYKRCARFQYQTDRVAYSYQSSAPRVCVTDSAYLPVGFET